jgi:mannitol-1-phosphate/altronate dehydrogenase
MKVFGTSIRALMNHMFLTITARGIEIDPKDIRWVLTVPAIWSDAAKQFMRKSANLVNTILYKINKNINVYHKMY